MIFIKKRFSIQISRNEQFHSLKHMTCYALHFFLVMVANQYFITHQKGLVGVVTLFEIRMIEGFGMIIQRFAASSKFY